MIRCSHCGKLAPTGALSCQNCGMPLVSGGAGVASAGQSEQQELPAWLESLRAHERPVPGSQENRQPFSLDELVDEDSMPSWMRQDRRKMPESGNSDSLPAIPVVLAGSDPEKQNALSNGFEAGSLIDERSLPGWMRENQGQGGGQPEAAQNVSANSLVDQQGLPTWIKDLSQAAQTPTPATNNYGLSAQPQTSATNNYGLSAQPQTSATNNYGLSAQPQTSTMNNYGLSAQPQTSTMNNYGLPAQPQTSTMNNYGGLPMQTPITPPAMANAPRVPSTPPTSEPPVAPAQGFSAHDLLDVQSMPGWMSGAQGPGQGPGPQPPTRPVPTSQGFSAGELIDQRSVPTWMRDLQGQERSDPQSAMGVPVSGMGQTTGMGQGITSGEGMPAGSLLERNSMPSWMQESQPSGSTQAPQLTEQGMSAGSLLDKNSMPSWMQENQLGSGTQPPQPPSQGMAAGSLIDMGSMPAWMRTADNGQPGPGAGGRPGQIQARPVPSRPRNEMVQQEQSEVAANIFSSMLGVAASIPALPGQEPMQGTNLGVAQGQPIQSMPPFQQAQPSLPGWQQPALNQYNQGVQPQAWQMSGAMPTINPASPPNAYAPTPNAYAPVNQPGGAGNWSQRANTPEQPAWGGYPTADKTALGVSTGAGKNNPGPGNSQQAKETKKKGFFDSIRDFFYH